MNDALDRIWAFHAGPWVGLFVGTAEIGANAAEFIRADIAADRIEADAAEITRLRAQLAEALARLIEAERSMHSFMHITDPTTYIKALHSDGLRQQVFLAKAALAFVLAAQKVKSELNQPKTMGKADG